MNQLQVPLEQVDSLCTLGFERSASSCAPQAVAWRVTPGGRSLIDRRRRSRVERNVRLVVEHLEQECGVPFGESVLQVVCLGCSVVGAGSAKEQLVVGHGLSSV